MKIFWSWQSDTPGKTGRHFIRKALNEAIEALKQPEDVEEPAVRELKDAVHLDHDRQGVTGSPWLLPTILKKIDASKIFVADVTPVSKISATDRNGTARREKRNMNPNVAIELGYALKSLTELNVLMVLNTHYGEREFLPFDIAGAAGPIMFNLPPDADAATLKSEAASLRRQFTDALRGFMAPLEAATPEFASTPHSSTPAVFFNIGEPLASFGEKYDRQNYTFDTDKGLYIRLIPHDQITKPFTKAALNSAVQGMQFDTFSSQNSGLGLVTANRYGVIAVEVESPSSGLLKSATQMFHNGEIWSFAPWVIADHGHGRLIPQVALERVARRALPRFLKIICALGLNPPFLLELGASKIEGYSIAVDNQIDTNLGPICNDQVSERVLLNSLDSAACDRALHHLFCEFCEASGYQRPAVIGGFPTL